MANVRINVFVTGKHPLLRDHLAGYGRAAGERLKLLASIGAMIATPDVELSHPVLKATGGKVLRLNVRLSGAFQEVTEQLGFVNSRSGMLVKLAALGLEFSHSPKGRVGGEITNETNSRPNVNGSETNLDDMDRIGLAAGLLNDDTIWR